MLSEGLGLAWQMSLSEVIMGGAQWWFLYMAGRACCYINGEQQMKSTFRCYVMGELAKRSNIRWLKGLDCIMVQATGQGKHVFRVVEMGQWKDKALIDKATFQGERAPEDWGIYYSFPRRFQEPAFQLTKVLVANWDSCCVLRTFTGSAKLNCNNNIIWPETRKLEMDKANKWEGWEILPGLQKLNKKRKIDLHQYTNKTYTYRIIRENQYKISLEWGFIHRNIYVQ